MLRSNAEDGATAASLYRIELRGGLSDVERFGGLFIKSLIPFVKDLRSLLMQLCEAIQLQAQSKPITIEDDKFLFFRRVVVQALIVLQKSASYSGDLSTHNTAVTSQDMEENRIFVMLISSIIDAAATNKAILDKLVANGSDGMGQIELELISCLRTWLWNADNSSTLSLDLLKTANLISQYDTKTDYRGYLAAIILGVDLIHSKKIYTTMQASMDELQWYISLFESMYVVMKEDKMDGLLAGREVIVLKNALEVLSTLHSHSKNSEKLKSLKIFVIEFMGILFDPMRNTKLEQQNANCKEAGMQIRALTFLSSLAAKGVNIDELLKRGKPMEVVDLTGDNSDSDDDGDDDMDVEELTRAPSGSITTSRTNRPSTSRTLRRQDLQTTNKLNQNYKIKLLQAQNDVVAWLRRKELLHSHTNSNLLRSLYDVSKVIGNGDVIVQLVSSVFQTNDDSRLRTKGILCTTLSVLLQNCSGIKERESAMSPLLSKLAFNPQFMEGLWAHVQHNIQSLSNKTGSDEDLHTQEMVRVYGAIMCFCDLFAHQMLALNDEEFLLSFTELNPNGSAKYQIRAVDVINIVKQQLYEVYWSKPIVADDFNLASSYIAGQLEYEVLTKYHRGRVLLSGTKLWNSIYVRWSRLYRTKKFCDDEVWYFPHLITRDQDERGAVDPRVAQIDASMTNDDDSTHSSNSAMEIDEVDISLADNENELLASSFKDPKMARILTSIPQAVPFDRRAKLFSSLLSADILKTQDETAAMQSMMWNMQHGIEGAEFTGRERVKIRRDKLYNDSMSQLNKLGPKLKRKVQVTFISEHGNEEAGVDGGGLFKEFLDDLIKNAFDPTNAIERCGINEPLFVESSLQTLSVNTNLMKSPLTLEHYKFLGRVLGKAVYESILVEPQFCLPLLNQLLGQHNTIDDLKNLDPVYYKHLNALRQMTSDQIDNLGLTFEVTVPSEDGLTRTIELIPGGSSVRVTKDNAVRYVHLVAHRRLNIDTAAQTYAMRDGFRDLIPASWVRLFSPYELQKIISGDDTIKGFDVRGLKNAMEYGGGYHPSQPIMIWFWEVIEEMSPIQKSQFLKFVTSCSRQPLLGFRALSPLPCVHQVRLRDEENEMDIKNLRLPTSSTCMNLLKLPNYKSKEILRIKLLYAIESGAGFELS